MDRLHAYDYTVQTLRAQLPIFHALDEIPWCSQTLERYTQWIWADDKTTIDVAVQPTGTVAITRHDDGEGRDGCDP